MNRFVKIRFQYKKIYSFLFLAMTFLVVCHLAQAQSPIVDTGASGYSQGNYQLNDFVILAIRVAQFIWFISGSLALLMFVYGGILFLISSGHSQMVDRARQTITGAVIGLAVVFGSYAIVYFIMTGVLHIQGNPLSSGWFKQ